MKKKMFFILPILLSPPPLYATSSKEINISGMNELHIACYNNDISTATKLNYDLAFEEIKNGWWTGYNAMHLLTYKGYTLIVDFLIKERPYLVMSKVKSGFLKGFFPINIAAYRGHEDIVKILARYSPYLAIHNNIWWNNYGSLDLACYEGHTKVCEFLIQNYPKLLVKENNNSKDPLKIAEKQGHQEIVEIIHSYKQKVVIPCL